MELGKNLAKFRKLNNMKSADLAMLVGVGQPYISEIETGKKTPSIEVLQKISKALHITTSELLGEVQQQLEDKMVQLVDAARTLDDRQVDALIDVIHAFTYTNEEKAGNYRVAEDSKE